MLSFSSGRFDNAEVRRIINKKHAVNNKCFSLLALMNMIA